MQSRFWTGGLETAQSKLFPSFDCNSGRSVNKKSKKQKRNNTNNATTKEIHRGGAVGVTSRLAVVGAVRETLVLDTEK